MDTSLLVDIRAGLRPTSGHTFSVQFWFSVIIIEKQRSYYLSQWHRHFKQEQNVISDEDSTASNSSKHIAPCQTGYNTWFWGAALKSFYKHFEDIFTLYSPFMPYIDCIFPVIIHMLDEMVILVHFLI